MPKTGRPPVERATVQCETCGKDIVRRVTDLARNKTGRFFCSWACSPMGDNRAAPTRRGTKPIMVPERPCERCGKAFRPKSNVAVGRWCSRSCSDAARVRAVVITCDVCGADVERKPSEIGGRVYCSRACYSRGVIRAAIDREHNGKPVRQDRDGYLWLWEPEHPESRRYKGWIAEHRLVAEQVIGRLLTSSDEVRHINRIRNDNRPENLEVLDNETHRVISRGQRQSDKDLLAEYIRRFGPLDDG